VCFCLPRTRSSKEPPKATSTDYSKQIQYIAVALRGRDMTRRRGVVTSQVPGGRVGGKKARICANPIRIACRLLFSQTFRGLCTLNRRKCLFQLPTSLKVNNTQPSITAVNLRIERTPMDHLLAGPSRQLQPPTFSLTCMHHSHISSGQAERHKMAALHHINCELAILILLTNVTYTYSQCTQILRA
jgi:hypothetical protein